MKLSWKYEVPSLALVACSCGFVAWAWSRVGDRVPVHFNVAWQADRYGGKAEALLSLPAVCVTIYAVSLVWPYLDPRGINFDAFARTYAIVRAGILALVVAIQVAMYFAVTGRTDTTTAVLPLAGAIAMILLGNYLPKIQPNWFMGVRTPWTLTSDLAWHLSHRLAGRLLVVTGLSALATIAFYPAASGRVLLGGIVATAVTASVYSYLVWRKDPNRRSDPPQRILQ